MVATRSSQVKKQKETGRGLNHKQVLNYMLSEILYIESAGFFMRLRWLFTGVKMGARYHLKRAKKEAGQ